MGRSYRDESSEEHDRRRVRKHLKKNNRNTDKNHLREYTGNFSEDDFLDMEDDYEQRKPKHS